MRSSRSMQSSNVKFFYHKKALSSWAFGPFKMASDTGCTEVIYQPGHGHLSRSLKQHNQLSWATEISWMTTIFPNPMRPVFINRPVIIWKPIDTRLSITDPNRGWMRRTTATSPRWSFAYFVQALKRITVGIGKLRWFQKGLRFVWSEEYLGKSRLLW